VKENKEAISFRMMRVTFTFIYYPINTRKCASLFLKDYVHISDLRVDQCYCTAEKKCDTDVMDTVGKREKMVRLLVKIT